MRVGSVVRVSTIDHTSRESTSLLRAIAGAGTGFLEVSWTLPGGGHGKEWFPLDHLDAAADRIERLGRKQTVYVGAAPRWREKGGKASVREAWALWADCDSAEATQRLVNFNPKPSLIIESGTPGNVHAWWSLTSAAPALWVERANRRIAHHLGADPKCAERARLLRPPGTLNLKHDPPRPVVVAFESGERFALADVVADLTDPKQALKPARKPRRVRVDGDPLLGISAREYIPALTGRVVDHSGKVKCPFHGNGDERTPSLLAYSEPSRGFHCFGCGASGSVYNFAGLLWNITTRGQGFLELRARLLDELKV